MKFRILPDRHNPVWLIGASSAWMASAANIPLWTELRHLNLLATPAGLAFAGALAMMIGTTLAALLSLLADPARGRAIGAAGRRRVESEMSRHAMVKARSEISTLRMMRPACTNAAGAALSACIPTESL